METILLIEDIGDPYEPGFTIAVCTSKEEAKNLFKEIWDCIEERNESNNNRATYIELHSGRKEKENNLGCPPTPYISEIELNKILKT